MLTLQVKEQIIENLTPDEKFIRGTVGAKCQIKFDEFWSKYEKTVVFQRKCQKPINIIVNELDNEIEILEKHGKFKIGVFGIIENEVLPTLWSTDIEILCGTDTHGTNPQTYTPSEIDQLRLSKQDKLTAGDGITIDENNVISARGTTEYEMLENKPQINGVELVGNKSLSELGIEIPTKTSELENDSGFIDDTAFENYYTKTEVDEKTVVDQTYNKNSQNAQSGKAVAKAVNGCVPRKKIIERGSPFDSVIAVNNSDYNQGLNDHGMPNDSTYYYINAIGDDIGKNMDGYLGAFANSIPRRDSKGNLFTGTPIDDEDCANKKYVDEAVASSGGGGGSITVDQTYNAESENAQSGKAVAEAVKNKVDKLNLSKVETLDKFTNATKGLYISNSWSDGEARLAKLSYDPEPNTVACRGGDGQIPVAMYGNDNNGNFKIWKGNAIPSEFFTYWFHYYLNGDLVTLKGKTKTLEEGAKLQNETIANKKITSAYNNRQLDWNSMYLIVSNTGDFDIQIYDDGSKSVVLDGDGNALPASKMCLLILPKENTKLNNNGEQGKLCMFVGITGKSINIASNFKALQFSIKNNANLYLPNICQVSTFKIGL